MSVIQNDLDPDVLIGVQLPLGVHQDGVFKQTQTLLEQTKSNIRNLKKSINFTEMLTSSPFGLIPSFFP